MKLFAKFWISALLLGLFFVIEPAIPVYGASGNIDRLQGNDRYQTAVAISQKGWDTSEYVILVRGDDFADGLCAVPLATKYDAPILMTHSGYLNQVTLDEIQRLNAKHILIMGGNKAVSENVEKTLRQTEIMDIRRISGQDRYETSVLIAQELTSSRAVLATGEDFPDALSISAPAAQAGMPILLTRQSYLPGKVQDYFKTTEVTETYIIGGETVISKNVAGSVPAPNRLSGSNRYLTNIAVIKHFESNYDYSHLYVADGGGPRGNEFADALAGAVLAAKSDSPLILADNNLPKTTGDYLRPKITIDTNITGLGGKNAVPDKVLQSIPNLLITESGNLSISLTRAISGQTKTIKLSYVLGESFADGTLEFILPNSVTAVEGQYTISTNASAAFSDSNLADSGRKVTVTGVNGKKNEQITLALIDKSMEIGNHKFKVLADADGTAMVRLKSSGSGDAAKLLYVNSAQLGNIKQQFISQNRSYQALQPEGIVIHSTATPGSTAQGIYNYFNSGYRASSAHYVADWQEIIQMIPEGEIAWHAGRSANVRYLSIEMCEPKGTNPQEFQKVWDKTVLLAADACVRYGWNPRKDIFSHYIISNTYKETDHTDPIGYLAKYNRTWEQLLKAIEAKMSELT